MSDPSSRLVKVRLTDGENQETLWAADLGKNLYRLDNQPWYATGVSCEVVVEACASNPGDIPDFVRVVKKSGNRTVRLILPEKVEDKDHLPPVLSGLTELGCDWEGASRTFFAVTIPPSVNLQAVRDFLINSGVQWEHADPKYEDLFPEET